MTRQFDKANVSDGMKSILYEFPEIFLKPSGEVEELFGRYGNNKSPSVCVKREDLCNLRYGFEHGDGWAEVVKGFCKDMVAFLFRAKAAGKDLDYKSFIMKEKFGEFTPQGTLSGKDRREFSDEYWDIIEKWAAKSRQICEKTGKKGKLTKGKNGWIKTLCPEEFKK